MKERHLKTNTMRDLTQADPYTSLYSKKRHVIACATVIEEMLPFLPEDVSQEILDFGLHLTPNTLKTVLQEKIDEASKDAEVLLLGYGLCSMAVVGLKATTATLVVPRTDDCIGIFLGSCDAYKEQSKKEPGTYYLTKGWIEAGDTPFNEHQILIEKYGEERAAKMTKLLLRNYKRLAFIDTGNYEIEHYRNMSKEIAKEFELNFEEIEGSSALVEKMIFGPWDEEFLVVQPGQTIAYQDFVNNDPR